MSSGKMNGKALPNGTAYGESGERVLVYREFRAQELHGSDDIRRAALNILCGIEPRSYRQIAKAVGCSAGGINRAVQIMAKRLGMRTPKEELKAKFSAAQKGHPYWGTGKKMAANEGHYVSFAAQNTEATDTKETATQHERPPLH